MGALWSAPAKRRGSRAGRPKSLTSQFLCRTGTSTVRDRRGATLARDAKCAARKSHHHDGNNAIAADTPSALGLVRHAVAARLPRARAALALALTPTASVLGAAAPVSGLTDASPLVTRAGAPDASLCEDGESGHRKATTAGDAHLKLDELDEAEACYLARCGTRATSRWRCTAWARCTRGRAATASRSRRTASATACWPCTPTRTSPSATSSRARTSASEADAAYTAAVEAAPSDPLAWEALGKHQLSSGRFQLASNTYRRAIIATRDGDIPSPGLILGLARAARGAKNFPECVSHAERAASLAPGFGGALHEVGACKLAGGDAASAIRSFREAARVEPDVAEHRVALANALEALGRLDEAAEALGEGIGAMPRDASLQRAMEAVLAKGAKKPRTERTSEEGEL